MTKVKVTDLKLDMIIYDQQARFSEFDYHPQRITRINKTDNKIEVYEQGIKKYFEIPINNLYFMKIEFEGVKGNKHIIH